MNYNKIYDIIKPNLGYGMNIYEILKEKANNVDYKDRIIYYDLEANREYSFSDVFKIVNNYVNMFSKLDIQGKKKYLIVDNSVDSVVIFIALLKCDAKPVLINKFDLLYYCNHRYEFIDEKDDNSSHYNQVQNLKYDYIIANDLGTFSDINSEIRRITAYLNRIKNIDLNDDGDFYICTSGVSEGTGKLVPLKENDLIERTLNRQKDYSILTTISISSISGMIYNVFRPIICNVRNYLLYQKAIEKDRILKYVSFYHINKILSPINILDMLNDDLKKLDFSSLDTIYLSGEASGFDAITKIREYLPNLGDNVIANMYGRTENYGDICICHENKIKSLYINVLASSLDTLVYTYDKKHIYKMSIKDGEIINEELSIKYEDNYYANYLSASETLLDNVRIDGNIIGEIIADGQYTGDLGFYLNNQLYVIGRKKDLVLINGKQYYLPMYEQMFRNITGLKTAAILNEDTNNIFLVVNYNVDPKLIDNFKRIIPLSNRCNEIIDNLNIPIEYPLFVDSARFPKSNQMHKTQKGEIKNLIKYNNQFQKTINNYTDSFIKTITNIIETEYHKNVSVLYQNNEFVFKKSEISFGELYALGGKFIGYVHLKDDDENFYCVIDDCVLLSKFPDYYVYNPQIRKRNVESLNEAYLENKELLLEKINREIDRNIHYNRLKLVGIITETDDEYVFKPYQIVADNNYNGTDKLYGDDLPFINSNNGVVLYETLKNAVFKNVFFSDEEIKEYVNKYSSLFNHTYQIKKSDMNLYVDNRIDYNFDDYNDIYHMLYRNQIHIPFSYGFKTLPKTNSKPYKVKLSNNNVILVKDKEDLPELFDGIPDYDRIDLYNRFKMLGLNLHLEYGYGGQYRYLIEEAVLSFLNTETSENMGFIISTNYFKELSLCPKNNMELFNLTRVMVIKKMYDLIEEARKMGKRELRLFGHLVEVDLSKIKFALVVIDDDETDLDYILNIIDDCNIIKWKSSNKRLRREL